MTDVTIVDYGSANMLSVTRAFRHCGADVKTTSQESEILSAKRLVVPGVGAFGNSMRGLADRNLVTTLQKYTMLGRPYLGICVGMQMLFEVGYEFGETPGLGLLEGAIEEIPKTSPSGVPHKIPHIGWSPLIQANEKSSWRGTLLEGLSKNSTAYFVHSFSAHPTHVSDRVANCNYNGQTICAAVGRDNIFGCQFHPEKSGETGLLIIRNFLSRS